MDADQDLDDDDDDDAAADDANDTMMMRMLTDNDTLQFQSLDYRICYIIIFVISN
jgi:hypothetical protein